jgi:hypothetical protein
VAYLALRHENLHVRLQVMRIAEEDQMSKVLGGLGEGGPTAQVANVEVGEVATPMGLDALAVHEGAAEVVDEGDGEQVEVVAQEV